MSGELLNGGAGTGIWGTDANWSSLAKPVNNDDAIIPPELAYNVSMPGDETGVDLDLLQVHRDYARTFGTSASPIQIASDVLKIFGSTGFYFEGADDGGAGLQIDETLIQMPNANTPVELGTKAGSTSGEWIQIRVDRGALTIKANCLFTAAGELVLNSAAASAILTEGADTLEHLRVNAGTVLSNITISHARIHGGVVTQDKAVISEAHVFGGGRLVYDHATLSTVIVYNGGTLDLLQNAVKKTIGHLYLYPGANILWDPDRTGDGGPGGLHSVSNFHDFRGWAA